MMMRFSSLLSCSVNMTAAIRKGNTVGISLRKFSTPHAKRDEVREEIRRKNVLVAVAILAFVGGVYSYAISRMSPKEVNIFLLVWVFFD
jgi:hypothetical protein